MKEYTQEATDIKTLIGQQVYPGYEQQQKDREALESLEACENEPLICFFCKLNRAT